MSSGFGFKGGEGRCYQFWKTVEQCSKDTEVSGQCGKQVEDYLECLHHRKELTRMNVVIAQKEKEEVAAAAAARHGGDQGHGGGH
uniref:NADH dehydrogenase [ubiquinone] iron-sulfur protein 5 n=1 Tax=Hyaloperonospora arabidopsidis (strain Emoy2) TaxID=559515 RepID=M4B8G7_HYAAE